MIEGGSEFDPGDIDVPEGQEEEYARLFGQREGGQQPSPQELAQAQNELLDTVRGRMTKVHEVWKQDHGHTDKTWTEIMALPDSEADESEETLHFAPGAIEFEPVWHDGDVLGGERFMLSSINAPVATPDPMDEDSRSQYPDLSEQTPEAAIGSADKALALLTTRRGKTERWTVFLAPDSPPYAVNLKDAVYLNRSENDPGVADPIRKAFGDDAAPYLSLPDIRQLTDAVVRTQGHVANNTAP